MTAGNPALAFLAGVLSIFSPCVLPLVPLVFGAAAAKHRYAPVALTIGLACSFVLVGLLIATVGHSVGLDVDTIRYVASFLIVLVGAVLLIPSLQHWLEGVLSPIAAWADGRVVRANGERLGTHFLMGALLGAAWSPCVGPTLGAASLLAAQGRDLSQVAFVMLAFGVGAALPLLMLGLLSQKTLAGWRGHISSAAIRLKSVLGGVLVVLGVLVITGADKVVETTLVGISPAWLTDLTTRF